ncbi:hypothetical protein LLG07_07330 [bacterium]|nr:hypothetical protein [bacterium]
MNSENLKPDEIKKSIFDLLIRHEKLINKLLSPDPMIEGCIHIIYKKCGNPKCHCKDGKLHGPYTAIVRKQNGKSKLTYVDKLDIIDKAKAYKKYNKRLASLRKINEKIFSYLRYLRDINTTIYEK